MIDANWSVSFPYVMERMSWDTKKRLAFEFEPKTLASLNRRKAEQIANGDTQRGSRKRVLGTGARKGDADLYRAPAEVACRTRPSEGNGSAPSRCRCRRTHRRQWLHQANSGSASARLVYRNRVMRASRGRCSHVKVAHHERLVRLPSRHRCVTLLRLVLDRTKTRAEVEDRAEG